MVDWRRFRELLNTDASRVYKKEADKNYKNWKNRANFIRDFSLEDQYIQDGKERYSPVQEPEETAIRIDLEQAFGKGAIHYGATIAPPPDPRAMEIKILSLWKNRAREDATDLHGLRNIFVSLSTATCQEQMKFAIAKVFGDKGGVPFYRELCQYLIEVINGYTCDEGLFLLVSFFKKRKKFLNRVEEAKERLIYIQQR